MGISNRDWLFSLPLEEQYAWMNAEHQDGTLDGDTAALNARINELRAHERELRELCRQTIDERELYREALSQLLDTVTDGMSKVSAILDNYDEGMA